VYQHGKKGARCEEAHLGLGPENWLRQPSLMAFTGQGGQVGCAFYEAEAGNRLAPHSKQGARKGGHQHQALVG